MPGAHVEPPGQGGQREVGAGVVGDVLLELAQGPAVGDLGLELGTELSLVARPAQEDDQDPGDVSSLEDPTAVNEIRSAR